MTFGRQDHKLVKHVLGHILPNVNEQKRTLVTLTGLSFCVTANLCSTGTKVADSLGSFSKPERMANTITKCPRKEKFTKKPFHLVKYEVHL